MSTLLQNDAGAWFNTVSNDGSIYTPLQLGFFATGCLLWVVAYVLVLVQARKYRVVEMAVLAGASNLAWEFVWGVLLRTDMGVFLVWTYRAWLFFDLFIFWQVIKLGGEQFTHPVFKRYYQPIVWGSVLFFIALYWTMTLSGLDTPIGARSAYICQFVISALCLVLLVQQPSTVGLAWPITWLRSLGTALVSVFMLLHYPQDAFLLLLCAASTLLDIIYCGYFLRLRSTAAAPAHGLNTAARSA
ncbi:hypothetical protein IGB42_02374 [Andreprevotia sp. IGB-42]|uniref:transmembrane-type terpene cyclase n=1 Tax=Andreprevotia sp. IGB-42 TaxID=2497473 RepID=UPI00135916EF|nr:hypothetical protein [Andreprevotia sp. IGB-42]KAF0812978.1 hypothetical protein IGB42_02374 [Andreprevotia sp. IGB-42]